MFSKLITKTRPFTCPCSNKSAFSRKFVYSKQCFVSINWDKFLITCDLVACDLKTLMATDVITFKITWYTNRYFL